MCTQIVVVQYNRGINGLEILPNGNKRYAIAKSSGTPPSECNYDGTNKQVYTVDNMDIYSYVLTYCK